MTISWQRIRCGQLFVRRYTELVSGSVFDVYVEGGKDASLTGQMKLAAAIAGRYRIPAPQVAEAMSKGRFRVGKGLDQATAEKLAQQLDGLGAMALIHPLGAPLPPSAPRTAVPRPAGGASGTISGPSSGGTIRISGAAPPAFTPPVAARPGPVPPLSSDGAISLSSLATMPASGPLELPAPSLSPAPGPPKPAPAAGLVGRDPFAPPPSQPLMEAMSPRPNDPAPARDPFSVPEDDPALAGSGLEIGELRRSSGDLPAAAAPSISLSGAAGIANVGPSASRSASGLAVEGDGKNLHSVRCPKHGLYYDTTKTSGCRKCLEPARTVARRMERRGRPFRLDDIADQPVKRAFIGLGIALVLGFVPAAYYAWSVNAKEVLSLRETQGELSKRAATDEVLRQFDAIDVKVDEARSSGMQRTFLIWVLVTGAVAAGWYKIT